MPLYFFHVDDGDFLPDQDGTKLPDHDAAAAEAVSTAGQILAEVDGGFRTHSKPWVMHVTDADMRLLFSLHFAAEVPSGDVYFDTASSRRQPDTEEDPRPSEQVGN